MALTWKQKAVIDFALKNDNHITKKQAMELIDDHYCNGAKHVGDTLSRMVNRGLLVRVKNGLYKVGNPKSEQKDYVAPNQIKIEI